MAQRDKKVDLKLSNLSRFGLGRGNRGGAGPSRLPSLKPTRDLTLGGAAPKRTFTPNIVQRSVKKEGDNLADSGKGPDKRPNRGRGRGRGARGARGGRGRGRGEIIYSTGIFSQGIFQKETLAGALSGGYLRGGETKRNDQDDLMDTTGESKSAQIKSVKGEEEDDSGKILELLADEGKIEVDDDEIKSGGLMPITLPLVSKLSTKIKLETDIKSGSSAVEDDSSQDEAESKIKPTVKLKKPVLKGPNLYASPIEINDIFKPQGMEDGQLFFLQLPDVLPINAIAQDAEEDVKMEGGTSTIAKPPPSSSSTSSSVTVASNSSVNDIEEQLKKFSFTNVSEGHIGKLQIHKSGKVKMRLGNVTLDLSLGTPCGFLQDLISVNTQQRETADMVCLGHVNHRLIATPDYNELLGSL